MIGHSSSDTEINRVYRPDKRLPIEPSSTYTFFFNHGHRAFTKAKASQIAAYAFFQLGPLSVYRQTYLNALARLGNS
jgi:hypothetical protein